MNKKGFTLVEVLTTLIIISLISAIAVPSAISISNRIKNNLLIEKLNFAGKAAVIWADDHNECFTTSKICSSLDYLTNDTKTMTVRISIGDLASAGYFSYDDKVLKTIENPIDKSDLSEDEITITYDLKTKIATTELFDTNTIYQLSFNGNESTSGSMETISCGYNKNCLIPSNKYKRTNYTFSGWAETASGTVKYANSANIKLKYHKTLYAIWKAIPKYKITFNGNGSTNGSMASIECYQNQTCSIPSNVFVRTNYQFLGWSETAGGAVKYANSTNITLTAAKTLYAVWKIVDTIPPSIILTPNKSLLSGTDVYASSVAIKISATDNLTGINNIKYCTTSSSTCNPTTTIANNSNVNIAGKKGTALNTTLCVIATDGIGNTSSKTCKTYKADSETPYLSCTDNNNWSKTTSTVTCNATDNVGIRRLEMSKDGSSWSTFSNINQNGPFQTNYSSSFTTNVYRNYVRLQDAPGLTRINNYIYSKVDTDPPLALTFDIKNTVENPDYNIREIVCTNNETLPSGEYNPNYNMHAHNECTVYTRRNASWWVQWFWMDDWTGNSGYSGISHITFTGCGNSSYYVGGEFPSCFSARTGRTLEMYTVDIAGNKSPYYLKFTIN